MNEPKFWINATGDTCFICQKPYLYVGDVPEGGWVKGAEPYCTCREVVSYKYCSHCGHKL